MHLLILTLDNEIDLLWPHESQPCVGTGVRIYLLFKDLVKDGLMTSDPPLSGMVSFDLH